MKGLDWRPIVASRSTWLGSPFDELEIRMTIFECERNNESSRTDGFSMAIFQDC